MCRSSSKLVADLLTTAGADRALVVDLHAPQIQGFFNIPVDHLFASPVLVDYFRELNLPELTVVSPDAGGVERARFFAKKMDSALAIVDKRRTEMNVTEVMHVIGDVQRPHLPDPRRHHRHGGHAGEDRARRCWMQGAAQVYACASHAVLSGPAMERISQVGLERSGGDQHHSAQRGGQNEPKIKVLSIAGLIGRAIQSIHEETSVSKLFI